MIPFVLYLTAGIVTAVHVYSLMLLAIAGVAVSPLGLVSLAGSLALVIAAYVNLFKPHAAARIALVAALAMWSFYGPAVLHEAGRVLTRWR